MTARPIPAFLRAPTADDIVERVRAALPALDVARKNARQALTGGPVSLDERARVADLLDHAVAELHAAVAAPTAQTAPPPRHASGGPASPAPAHLYPVHTCRSGRHTWTDEADADRCCNGYRRQLRASRLEPGDDPALARPIRGLSEPCWWVWVPDTGDAA